MSSEPTEDDYRAADEEPAEDRATRRAAFLARLEAARAERATPADERWEERYRATRARLAQQAHRQGMVHFDGDLGRAAMDVAYREQLRKRGRPAFGPPSDAERLAATREQFERLGRDFRALKQALHDSELQNEKLREELSELDLAAPVLPDPLPAVIGTWHWMPFSDVRPVEEIFVVGRIDGQTVSFKLTAVGLVGDKVRSRRRMVNVVTELLNVASALDPEDYEYHRRRATELLELPEDGPGR